MTRDLVVHPEAQLEIEEAALWYEAHAVGLGLEFVASLNRAFAEIVETPERFAQ